MSGTVTTQSYDLGGALGVAVSQSELISARLNTLTQQASNGYVSDTFAGLGANASVSLSLNATLSENQAVQDGITAATGQMGVTQNALSQISSIASTFLSDTADLNNLDSSQIDSIAANAREGLQQVASLLDTQDGDAYVFSGQDSTNPPVPDPADIASSGFATQIAAAVGNLATAGGAATAAATLAIASSNAPGTSPFSTALSQPASSVNALRPSVNTGGGVSVPTGILASANSDAVSGGTSTTGSYIRDIMRALATIGSMSSSQANVSGFSDLVADTSASLNGAISALNTDAGVLGDRQTSLTALGTNLGNTATALQSQISNVQDVDMAQTLSKLSSVQTQLQVSYQVIASVQSLSLAKYISTTS